MKKNNFIFFEKISKLKNDEILIAKNKYFVFVNFINVKIPSQGWKIHVSAFFDNYLLILRLVYNYCLQNNISFKYIKTINDFYYNISNMENPVNSGKFITIYPKNLSQFKTILNNLDSILKKQKGPRILTDLRYKNNMVLYYRYGIIGPNKKKLNFGKKRVPDLKMPFFNLPKEVKKPFEIENFDKISTSFIKEYLILKFIDFSNSGGIFLCSKNEEKKLFVLKEARSFIGYSKTKTEVFFKKKEVKNLKLNYSKHFPKFVESFYFEESFFIVKEFLPGKNLGSWKIDNNLVDFLISSEKQKKIIIKLIFIIKKLLNIMEKIHSKNLILNDIKLNNFILDRKRQIYFIDLENLYNIDNKNSNIFIKSNWVMPKMLFSKNDYIQDSIKMHLMIIEITMSIPLHWINAFSFKNIHEAYILFCKYHNIHFYLLPDFLLKNYSINKNEIYIIPFFKVQNLLLKMQKYIKNNLNYISKKTNIKKELQRIIFINEKQIKLKNILNENELNENSITEKYLKILLLNIEYERSRDSKFLNEALLIVEKIRILFMSKKNDIFYINNGGILDPSFISGLAGFVYCLLELYNLTKEKCLLKMLKEYYPSIKSYFSFKINFETGILGFLFILLKYDDYKIISLNKKYIVFILNFIIKNIEEKNNEFVILDYEFKTFDSSFWRGKKGLFFIWKKILIFIKRKKWEIDTNEK